MNNKFMQRMMMIPTMIYKSFIVYTSIYIYYGRIRLCEQHLHDMAGHTVFNVWLIKSKRTLNETILAVCLVFIALNWNFLFDFPVEIQFEAVYWQQRKTQLKSKALTALYEVKKKYDKNMECGMSENNLRFFVQTLSFCVRCVRLFRLADESNHRRPRWLRKRWKYRLKVDENVNDVTLAVCQRVYFVWAKGAEMESIRACWKTVYNILNLEIPNAHKSVRGTFISFCYLFFFFCCFISLHRLIFAEHFGFVYECSANRL